MKALSVTTSTSVSTIASKTAEPLLVFHGWGMNSSVWKRIRAELEASFSVTWVDLPGHGKNTFVEASSLDEIVALAMSLIPDGVHLMGWSLGGLVAQSIAQKAPHKIKTLTLIASTPRFSQTEHWQYAMSESVLKNFAKTLQNDPEVTLQRFIALQFMGVRDSKKIQQELIDDVFLNQKYVKKGGGGYTYYLDALKLGLELLTHTDFRQDNPAIPQHWIFGKKDRLVPAEVINDLKLMRPDAQITLLENAGHAPFMTHPDEFTSSVLSFLKSYVG